MAEAQTEALPATTALPQGRRHDLARLFVLIVAALTLVWLALTAFEGFSALRQLDGSGSFDTEIRTTEDGSIVIRRTSDKDFVGVSRPAEGDTLVGINGQPATEALWEAELGAPRPIGHEVQLDYLENGAVRGAVLRLHAVDKTVALILQGFLIAVMLVALFYVAIALLAVLKQGHASPARVLALLNMALAMFVAALPPTIIHGVAWDESPITPTGSALLDVIGVLVVFAPGFWLHLALIFPRPVGLIRRQRLLLYVLCYLPALMALPAEFMTNAAAERLAESTDLLMTIQLIAAIVILWRKRKRAATQLERRQVRAVVTGVILGPVVVAVPILLGVLLALLDIIPDTSESIIIGMILLGVCLGLLPIPISFLYAFQRYRLMEVELRLRRGTRYALSAGLMLLVFFTLLYAVSGVVLSTLGVERRTGVLAIGLLLALAMGPVQRRTHQFVEQRFFPERRHLQAMLRETLAASALMPDRAALWDHLDTGLRRALGVSAALPLLSDADARCYRQPDGTEAPFAVDGPLAAELRRGGRPRLVDELLTSSRAMLTRAETSWLHEVRASILLPMIVHSRLVGFVALVFPPGREDLAAEDLSVLTSVVTQFALQSEHLRLVEESVEKRRLEEQLEMARAVQQRFLPTRLPDTPGLELATRFRSSWEVAGDYYDVLPLSGDRTLLVVADVSGKGAGAAMIMANVQASLRSMAWAGVPLLEMVTALNESLCVNTSSDQFVTFFAAVFDPEELTLTCVNAGHNPPRLVHANGSVTELLTGGPVLGVLPEERYEAETRLVSPGDVLVAFTDGVCEAMDGTGSEFGEERIARITATHRTHSAETMAAAIETDVNGFHGTAVFEDDFTLLVAKVA